MELIKEALKKAKASGSAAVDRPAQIEKTCPPQIADLWTPPRVELDVKHLERHRIVSYAMTDPSHLAFNLLRTKIYRTMKGNGWRSLAILSPSAGCGKTTVSLNLGLSMARQANCRTVLIDLDLKKAAMAKALGVHPKASVGQSLEGKAPPEDCFLQIGDNFFVGLNAQGKRHFSELMQEHPLSELLSSVNQHLQPDILMFDLPPMLSTDEAIAFLPRVECSVLVIAAGTTTASQIDECERQAHAAGHYLGVVLNKCDPALNEHYQYDY